MSKKNKQEEINLKDFIWEEEEFKFQPKFNRHGKFLNAKKRQLQKENYANQKKVWSDSIYTDEHQRYMSKLEESFLEDYYDSDEDDFMEYRIK